MDFHVNPLPASTQRDAFYRRDIAVVAAPTHGDMSIGRHHVVGGVEIQPARARYIRRYPGMRCVRALQVRAGSQVAPARAWPIRICVRSRGQCRAG